MKLNERIQWSISLLDPQKKDTILEVGFGSGISLSYLVPLVSTGRVTGIDRSAHAVASATRNNKIAIAEKKLTLIKGDYREMDTKLTFNKIYAFNVNAFWIDPETMLQKTAELLGSKGKLYLFFQAPGSNKVLAKKQERLLNENVYTVEKIMFNNKERINSFCIISTYERKPAHRRK